MFGIYPKSFAEINAILENCLSIDEVIIYGSWTKGDHKEGSDIDITLLRNITEQDATKLWHDLDDSYIPYKYDISIHKNLNLESKRTY